MRRIQWIMTCTLVTMTMTMSGIGCGGSNESAAPPELTALPTITAEPPAIAHSEHREMPALSSATLESEPSEPPPLTAPAHALIESAAEKANLFVDDASRRVDSKVDQALDRVGASVDKAVGQVDSTGRSIDQAVMKANMRAKKVGQALESLGEVLQAPARPEPPR